jgi:hypothetical protein
MNLLKRTRTPVDGLSYSRVLPFRLGAIVLLVCWIGTSWTWATSFLPISLEEHLADSEAVIRGVVTGARCFQAGPDNAVYTETVFQVKEVFKGTLGSEVRVVHRGGQLADRGESNGFAPDFAVGSEHLVFLRRSSQGDVQATFGRASAFPLPGITKTVAGDPTGKFQAGLDLLTRLRAQTVSGPLPGGDLRQSTPVLNFVPPPSTNSAPSPLLSPMSTASNLMTGADLIPARFTSPDRGEGIPYLVDADFLPAGITLAQATNALSSALAAWSGITSLKFTFAGFQSFGVAAPNYPVAQGVLRIQLHDKYNYLPSSTVLGEGGRAWMIQNLSPGWTTGGQVQGNDFHLVTKAYVVLKHTASFMQNVTNFSEVLCHELGHVVGIAHSSENASEPNPLLRQAMMYYSAHGSGFGLSLNGYDIGSARQVYPPGNTPPYCYPRVLDAVTTPSPMAGINTAQVRGYDLQNGGLTLALTDESALNGSFSVSASNVTYLPNAFYADSPRYDPSSGSSYDRVYARFSDGVNASPFVSVQVLSFAADSYSEGIPDSWRLAWFGSANPSAGVRRHASDDYDGDGLTNLQEYLLGSTPTNRASNLQLTLSKRGTLSWAAKPYEVYEPWSSTNLISWVRAANPVLATNSTASISNLVNSSGAKFYRVLRVP